MTKLADRTLELFRSGHYCSESVLLAFAESRGLEGEHLCPLATGFGGGMGGSARMRGALSGGVLAIGLACGRKDPREAAALVKELRGALRHHAVPRAAG